MISIDVLHSRDHYGPSWMARAPWFRWDSIKDPITLAERDYARRKLYELITVRIPGGSFDVCADILYWLEI